MRRVLTVRTPTRSATDSFSLRGTDALSLGQPERRFRLQVSQHYGRKQYGQRRRLSGEAAHVGGR
jgi:hypothetical protein